MPNHQRGTCALLSSERQELGGKLAHYVALKRHIIRHPEPVEHREQQQGIFGRLSERFSLFDQQTCPLHGRLASPSLSASSTAFVISSTNRGMPSVRGGPPPSFLRRHWRPPQPCTHR